MHGSARYQSGHLANQRRKALDSKALHIRRWIQQKFEKTATNLAFAIRVRFEGVSREFWHARCMEATHELCAPSVRQREVVQVR